MSPRRPRLTRRRVAVGAGALAVLVAAAAAYVIHRRQSDVFNPAVPFHAEPPPAAPRPEDPVARFAWPLYGYTKDRRRDLPVPATLRPPFRPMWRVNARVLVEFSPVMGGHSLYLLDDSARLWAISKRSGRVRWKRRVGQLAASSPAYGHGVVYVTVLARARDQPGRVAAVRASDGRLLWSRPLSARTESSPLLDHGRLYFGAEDGGVYALRASDGAMQWKFHAQSAVKGGPALAGGRLYFGDYAGRAYAVREGDGHPLWQVGTSGAHFGFSSGNFYATPAVAFGRVYLGNTDGNVYSFSASDGRLGWRKRTSGYVYAAAAVAQPPGGHPTVYVGSYDGTFYALDARSGSVRWSYHDGGKISGAATVLGDVVYFANTQKRTTTGLSAGNGRVVFRYHDGAYNPVISDTRTIYLTGEKALYALRPAAR